MTGQPFDPRSLEPDHDGWPWDCRCPVGVALDLDDDFRDGGGVLHEDAVSSETPSPVPSACEALGYPCQTLRRVSGVFDEVRYIDGKSYREAFEAGQSKWIELAAGGAE